MKDTVDKTFYVEHLGFQTKVEIHFNGFILGFSLHGKLISETEYKHHPVYRLDYEALYDYTDESLLKASEELVREFTTQMILKNPNHLNEITQYQLF